MPITRTLVSSLAVVICFSTPAQAVVYNVNRSFADENGPASLIGTADIPLGHYELQGIGLFDGFNSYQLLVNIDGFTEVLSVTGSAHISTYGTGKFLIDATESQLIFSTANTDVNSYAYFYFDGALGARFAVGGPPNSEGAWMPINDVHNLVTFPLVFGTAIPEPTLLALAGICAFFRCLRRHAR